ncbi:PTS mannose transporter subunit EIIAB, partial [Lactobacillus delbrueckii subsp. lactis]
KFDVRKVPSDTPENMDSILKKAQSLLDEQKKKAQSLLDEQK